MSDALKPCPFCGVLPNQYVSDEFGGLCIQCTNCGVLGPSAEPGNKEAYLTAWNHRADLSPLAAQAGPVAIRHYVDGYGWQYLDSHSGPDWYERGLSRPAAEPLFDIPDAPALLAAALRLPEVARLVEAVKDLICHDGWGKAGYTDGLGMWEDAEVLRAALAALGGAA